MASLINYIFGSKTADINEVATQVAELKERVDILTADSQADAVPNFEQILASVTAGTCPTGTFDKFVFREKPKRDTLYENLYELLNTCLKTNNITILEKILPHYPNILTASITNNSFPELIYDVISIKHTICFRLAIEHGNIKAAIVLLRGVQNEPLNVSNLRQDDASIYKAYCNNIVKGHGDYGLNYKYKSIALDYQTLYKYKNETSVYKNLLKVYQQGFIHRVCICKTNNHESECMYNINNCQKCMENLHNENDPHIPEPLEQQLEQLADMNEIIILDAGQRNVMNKLVSFSDKFGGLKASNRNVEE